MAESTWTTMHIGGTLPATKIADLVEAIINDFHEIAEGPNTIDDNRYVTDVANRNESLLVQGQVNFGNPESVTTFCVENNLSFWLHYDAGPEWDASIEIWRPDMDAVKECPASAQTYVPAITVDGLRGMQSVDLTLSQVIEDLTQFESDKVPPLKIAEPVADEQEESANG